MSARRPRGFTLVELLVALFAMALLAVLSWRGLDGMVRAREVTSARADEVLTLQTGLNQWSADLDALIELPRTRALDWNGSVLRMTRRSSASPTDGVFVVAWTRRDANGRSMWLRWQSPPLTTRGQLEDAWQRAGQWARNPSGDDSAREVAITPLDDWQIFFFRQNAWTNPQSSDLTSTSDAPAAPAVPASGASAPVTPVPTVTAALPDGVRLVLSLPGDQAMSGVITRDWARPTLAGNKS
jgi:general secretion pathway protein J